jgi:hypothetical protein
MAETAAPDTEASTTDNPETSKLIPGKGMMRCGGRHGKGQGGMMHGGGRHGKGQGSMMHGGGRHDKGSHDNDRQVAQRLDMIEARTSVPVQVHHFYTRRATTTNN